MNNVTIFKKMLKESEAEARLQKGYFDECISDAKLLQSQSDERFLEMIKSFGFRGPAEDLKRFSAGLKSLTPFHLTGTDPIAFRDGNLSEKHLLSFLELILKLHYIRNWKKYKGRALYLISALNENSLANCITQYCREIRESFFTKKLGKKESISFIKVDDAFLLAQWAHLVGYSEGRIKGVKSQMEDPYLMQVSYKMFSNRIISGKRYGKVNRKYEEARDLARDLYNEGEKLLWWKMAEYILKEYE